MASPGPFHSDADVPGGPSQFVDIPSRPMRVKVLYTFDNDNQTNCLARLTDILRIPTLPIDETTQIGVIELRQCIRAIVAASPELVARLTQGDFTIYAYDYSEYETPLVGQGMLSTMLAANSPTPNAPAHQSRTMITGRVCKNIMGLFSNGVSETLEVKLRLVPVPKPVQSDYVKSMEMYRNMTPAVSAGFDPNAWSDSLNEDGIVANLERQSHTFPAAGSDSISRQRHMSNASIAGRPAFSAQRPSHASRPSSRTSVRSEHHSRQRLDQAPSAFEAYGDDGPSKKRAKITQTDWKGKSNFGGNQDSLRVTASTAASIRVHKPVATRPNLIAGHSLEPPPRVPTPVPQSQDPTRMRPRGQQSSLLRRESSLYQGHTPQSPFDMNSDAAMSSPEDMIDQLADGSPLEFPSSPPAMPDPSSPGVFAMPRPLDSGYMSGGQLEYMQESEDKLSAQEPRTAPTKARSRAAPQPRDVFIEQTPGPPELLPTRMNMSKHIAERQERSNSLALPPRPSLDPQTSSLSEAAMSGFTAQHDPHGLLDQSSYFRPPSTVPSREAAASPAPSDELAFGGKPRSGSGAKRKKVIHEKLLKSLASGDMPTYCYNCGAIETPTWRSLYIKNVDGAPTDEDHQEVEGETRGVEILEKDETTQNVVKFRIIKSVRKSKDKERSADNFVPIQVCNPCGLWFNKFHFMRPEEKWSRGPKIARKRPGKKDELQSDMMEPPSDFPQSDYAQGGFWTDAIQSEDMPASDPQEKASSEEEETTDLSVPTTRPVSRPRANSLQPLGPSGGHQTQWSNAALSSALQRAIQSSPARFLGTQESPIDLEDELTPKPTRRLLFPSPRKEGEVKSLDDTCLPTTKKQDMSSHHDPFVAMAYVADKENLAPLATDEEIAHLFGCSPFKTPSKPASSTKSLTPTKKTGPDTAALLSTPTPSKRRSMDEFLPSFSSAEKNALVMTPSRFLNASSSSPSANAGLGVPMTPFSRHLSQLLSDPAGGVGNMDFPDFGELTPRGLASLFSPGAA